MKRFVYATIGVAVLGSAGLGLAGAAAAAGSAADTVVNGLQTEGYVVTLNQTPTSPLSSCTVANVDKSFGTTSAYVDLVCPTGC